LWGIAYLKTAYVSDKQRHLTRLKVFTKVLNQDFNDFQFTRLNNVLAHGLDSLGGYHHIPDLSLQLQEKPEVQIDQKTGALPSRIINNIKGSTAALVKDISNLWNGE
jgi:hypothetical protein